MRVAILGQFPLDTSKLGGVEVAIVYLMDTLKAEGVDDLHIVTCLTDVEKAHTETVRGATVHYLPRQGQGRITNHRREITSIKKVLREVKPDIAHGHGTGLFGGAALGSGLQNVITAHGIVAREVELYTDRVMRLRGKLDVRYERSCLSKAADIIAISPYVEEEFKPYTKARFHLIENAVDRSFFEIKPQPEPGRILFAGSVIERKGLIPLMQAAGKAKQAKMRLDLRIAGPTPDQAHYDALLAACDAARVRDNVTFLGQLDQAHLLEEYARCCLFALPSKQETAPMAVQQALAAAVPVLATPVGGVPALVQDAVTGLLVNVGDDEMLAAALIRLLQDPGMRLDMGMQGRADAVKRFAPEVIAKKTVAVYKDILSKAKAK